MKNFDLNLMGVQELDTIEMKETDGGLWPAWMVFVAGALLGGVIYDVAKASVIESTGSLFERASENDYIIWADVGHR